MWKFNVSGVSEAAWWGGQFVRLTNGTLRWSELGAEIALSNHPLEDDVELSALTPNPMIDMRSNALPLLEKEDVS